MQVLLAAPLPLASIVAWTTFNAMFRRAQKVLSLRAAVDLDWRDQVPLIVRILGQETKRRGECGPLGGLRCWCLYSCTRWPASEILACRGQRCGRGLQV